ncbi:MAG: hypothetical protein AAFR17_17640 [Pseudomonadota bacterium]
MMEIDLRADISGALEVTRRDAQRRRSRHRVVAEGRDHRIVELGETGFVIEADGRPPLRGYVEIFLGEERIDRQLVICDWARDGLVGYAFKRDSAGADVPADYAASEIAGLLSGPERYGRVVKTGASSRKARR